MGENFEDFYTKLYSSLKDKPEIKLAYSPGTWQLKTQTEIHKNILTITNILFINREEAHKLTKTKASDSKEKDLLEAVKKLGPKTVVITDGSNGAFAYDGITYLKLAVLPIKPFEKTGAGDAFATGCLSGLMQAKPLKEALLWGMVNSSSVIREVGSQKGLLTLEKLPSWLTKCQEANIDTLEF